MKNKTYSRDEWVKILSDIGYIPVPGTYGARFMGRPVIPDSNGGVVIFYRCENCGSEDGLLDKYNSCGHCGAQICQNT